jgi:peroxiredoxin
MAVNRRVLFGSLGIAAVISVIGGYALSRSSNPSTIANDIVNIPSNSTFVEPGLAVNKVVQGKKLPTVNLVDNTGAKVSTASLLGQPLVLNVWATTCEACKKEMPALAQLNAEFGTRVRFIGVNQFANNDTALGFARDKGVKYELLSDQNGELITALGVAGLPYTLFIAPDGTIVAQKGIALDASTIRTTINSVLLKP